MTIMQYTTTGVLRYYKMHPEAEMPIQSYGEAIGYDISAYLISETGRSVQSLIPPRTTKVVPTGLVVLPPPGFFISVCSRSGSAARQPPIFVANAPGIIDPDYIGELRIILYNGGHESVIVKHGNRIAQLVLLPANRLPLLEITSLPETERGDRGFGSTDALG